MKRGRPYEKKKTRVFSGRQEEERTAKEKEICRKSFKSHSKEITSRKIFGKI